MRSVPLELAVTSWLIVCQIPNVIGVDIATGLEKIALSATESYTTIVRAGMLNGARDDLVGSTISGRCGICFGIKQRILM